MLGIGPAINVPVGAARRQRPRSSGVSSARQVRTPMPPPRSELAGDRLDRHWLHSGDARQISSIDPGRRKVIDKRLLPLSAVSSVAEGDQVSKAAVGQRVLIREQTVVRTQAHLMAAFHRSRHTGPLPSFRARLAGIGALKNTHTCAPFPTRERFFQRRQEHSVHGMTPQTRRHPASTILDRNRPPGTSNSRPASIG